MTKITDTHYEETPDTIALKDWLSNKTLTITKGVDDVRKDQLEAWLKKKDLDISVFQFVDAKEMRSEIHEYLKYVKYEQLKDIVSTIVDYLQTEEGLLQVKTIFAVIKTPEIKAQINQFLTYLKVED